MMSKLLINEPPVSAALAEFIGLNEAIVIQYNGVRYKLTEYGMRLLERYGITPFLR